jgi:O-antigen/teichoic acid export membrane protein
MFLDRAIRYVALLVLGGLLAPRDFGLFAALNVTILGLTLLQGFGIGQALIYRKERSDEAADTAFFVTVSLGVVLAAVAWAAAPLVASFYREEALVELFRAASVLLIIRAIKFVPYYLFEKALDFRKKFVPGLCASLAYLVVALTMAIRGMGAWSLVVAEIASSTAEGIAYWVLSPWRPKLRFVPSLAREDLVFGWAVLGGALLVFAFRNVDRIVVSRVLGTHELGLYAFAYMIANTPVMLFTRVLNTVLLPSYSALDEDRERQARLFFRATSYLAGASALFVLGLLAFGGYLLFSLYGDKWQGAVVPLSMLALFGFFRALTDLSGDLLIGTGRPVDYRKVNALQLVLAAAGLYVGATLWGLPGVALAMIVSAAPSMLLGWKYVNGAIQGGAGAFARALRGPVIAFAALALPAYGLVRLLPERGSVAAVAVAAAVLSVCYLVVWLAVDPALRTDLNAWRRRRLTSLDDRGERR